MWNRSQPKLIKNICCQVNFLRNTSSKKRRLLLQDEEAIEGKSNIEFNFQYGLIKTVILIIF